MTTSAANAANATFTYWLGGAPEKFTHFFGPRNSPHDADPFPGGAAGEHTSARTAFLLRGRTTHGTAATATLRHRWCSDKCPPPPCGVGTHGVSGPVYAAHTWTIGSLIPWFWAVPWLAAPPRDHHQLQPILLGFLSSGFAEDKTSQYTTT